MARRKVDDCKLVVYYRVSTDKQGKSKLGLEAQQAIVERYRAAYGCEIVATYQEVESGSDSTRVEMLKAIAHARRARCVLVVAKLDRLGRDVHYISGLLKDEGLTLRCADSPDDDPFILHLKVSFAEEERRKISMRTKEALAALKARGVVLGKPENLTDRSRLLGAMANRDKALTAHATVAPLLRQWRVEGKTLQAIADQLNAIGQPTRQGATWTPTSVKRVLDRSS